METLKGELTKLKDDLEEIVERNNWVGEKFDWMKSVEHENRKVMAENEKLFIDFGEYKSKYQLAELQIKKLNNEKQEMKGNIRVYCRVRPLSRKELDNKEPAIISVIDNCTVRVT